MTAGQCDKCGDGMWRTDRPCGRCSQKTLRDEFAMAALPSCIEWARHLAMKDRDGYNEAVRDTVLSAYQYADAMMAARGAK